MGIQSPKLSLMFPAIQLFTQVYCYIFLLILKWCQRKHSQDTDHQEECSKECVPFINRQMESNEFRMEQGKGYTDKDFSMHNIDLKDDLDKEMNSEKIKNKLSQERFDIIRSEIKHFFNSTHEQKETGRFYSNCVVDFNEAVDASKCSKEFTDDVKSWNDNNISLMKQPVNGLASLERCLRWAHKFRSEFLVPTEIQVNHFEVSTHPKEIHGIEWRYLDHEQYRLMTFVTYPSNSSSSFTLLASKGFAYNGNGSDHKIICCFCTAQLENPNIDNIDEEHKRLQADCPMVNSSACGNVPINEHHFKHPYASVTCYNQNDIRSSQPSDDSASFALVTNISDVSENNYQANSEQNIQSSQLMFDSTTPRQADSDSNDNSNMNPNGESLENTHNQQNNDQHDNIQQNTSQSVESSSPSNENDSEDSISHEKLGIIMARPKRPHYALLATRLASFKEWSSTNSVTPEDLAKAGFFYSGESSNSDTAQCFYCGGCLKNWSQNDNAWVEHARWFPKCPFLQQELGNKFIDVVLMIQESKGKVTYEEVLQMLEGARCPDPFKSNERSVENDAAVISVTELGYDKSEICKVAMEIQNNGEVLSSEKLLQAFLAKQPPKAADLDVVRSSSEQQDNEPIDEEMETMRQENYEMRQRLMCTICMDKKVTILFLPCRHFVTCMECSCALSACPVCRNVIRASVKVSME